MLRLSRPIWTQLAILAVITLIAVSVMAFGFIHVPALLGIGRYTVTVDLPATGGLYPTSVVTYRGTEIGRVKSVDVTRDGVQAVLTLNSDVKVPSDVTAAVHSRSAVGEQFIELTPKPNTNARPLGDGDVVPVGSVQIPADIGSLLDETNTALKAIPQDNLKTVVDEAAKAVGGLGPELSRIVDGSTSLAIEAGKTKDSFTTLIDQFPAVANSQVQTSDSIATWAHHMASITGQIRAQDPAFADLLQKGGPALNEGKALFDRVAPALPVLLANLVSLGQIAVTYRSDIEQLLVLFPQGTAVMSAIALPNADTKQAYKGIYLDFNLNLNSPPPCNTGFLPVQQQRSPSDQDAPDRTKGELYCRVPQDSPLNVRGVRNIPCENDPAKRAPTVELCESDERYVPLNDGNNWKG
ncbi:MAG: phospholipid/cholesterol/gamma-HCH transport system substrate-binding protein, partial [Mycobacterium sp.]|nr:phospholipid/cholesterol/gamma-HCH transport system substrate-binding protein [Mycobacterium sp.]